MVDAGADWLHLDVMVRVIPTRAGARHCVRKRHTRPRPGRRPQPPPTPKLPCRPFRRHPSPPPQDGHFVPNLTLGAPVVASLRKHTRAYLDCHLMVSKPEQWVDDFAAAGADGFTFHVEATGEERRGAASDVCERLRARWCERRRRCTAPHGYHALLPHPAPPTPPPPRRRRGRRGADPARARQGHARRHHAQAGHARGGGAAPGGLRGRGAGDDRGAGLWRAEVHAVHDGQGGGAAAGAPGAGHPGGRRPGPREH
jgi:hypothetical protein